MKIHLLKFLFTRRKSSARQDFSLFLFRTGQSILKKILPQKPAVPSWSFTAPRGRQDSFKEYFMHLSFLSPTFLAAVIALSLPPAAEAAEAAEPYALGEVIVTATRTERSIKDVPAASEVITSEDIARLGAADVYDALRLADDVTAFPSSNGFGRSISLRGGQPDQTLILVNGRRTANEDTATAQNLMSLERVNVSHIDRIEIVRGAASAQYGSDALNGVINIITKKSGSTPSVTIGGNTGTESMNNYYHIDMGKQGKFSSTLDMSFGKDRPRMMQDHGIANDPMGYLYGPKQNYNFGSTYEFNDHQALDFTASYYKSDRDADWPTVGKSVTNTLSHAVSGAITEIQKKNPNFSLSQEKQDQITSALFDKYLTYNPYKAKMDVTQKDFALGFRGKSPRHDYAFRTYWSELTKDRLLPYEIFGNMGGIAYDIGMAIMGRPITGTALSYGDHNKYSVWGLEGKDTWKAGANHTVTYGGEYTSNKIEGSNIAGASKNTELYSFYAQDEWRVSDKLLLIPAVRYDHHSDFGSKTTPKIGATYFLSGQSRVKANYGKGFKAPSVTELYSDYYHMGIYFRGNPDLVPEESTNFDIAYEREWGRNFGKITYFHNETENMISTRYLTKTLAEYYNLDGTTKVEGIELTYGRELSPRWSFKVNSTWTGTNNADASLSASTESGGHSEAGYADNLTTIAFTYDDHDRYGWTAVLWDQLAYNYQTSTDKATFHTVNLAVTKKLGDGRVFLGLDNLFNKKVDFINLDGRMWRTGFEWTF